jgi:O-antigen/teichoic acid export membrane protein
MKFFVIACCFMFLGIAVFLDVFKWIFANLANPKWAEGLDVVPLLAMGNIFLGIYYNLSIWYKLTGKNTYGALITIGGAIITIVANVLLIPVLHYTGAALATYLCYFFMMAASYVWGQKHYPVPYPVKKLAGYLTIVVILYVLHLSVTWLLPKSLWISVTLGMIFFAAFATFVYKIERKEISRLFKR